jgi:putative endonuclease
VRERLYYVYILASRVGGTLYIGVTNDLVRRAYEHRKKLVKGFTKRYGVGRLVCFEQFGEVGAAIQREKQLKKWKRVWKIQLIEEKNPNWDDLYPAIAVPLVYWMPAFAGMTMERRIPAFGNDNISG